MRVQKPSCIKEVIMAEIEDVMDKLEDVLEKLNEVKSDVNAERSIQSICHHCGGDGQKGAEGETITCPDCGGDGVVKGGRITLTEDE